MQQLIHYFTDPCAIDETVVDLMCSLESPTHYEIQAAGLCNGLCLTATSFGKECWTVLDIDKYVICRSRGGTGGSGPPPPEKITKNKGFLSNTGLDPLKNHKATEPTFNVGPSPAASKTPFKWRFAGGPVMARFSIWIHSLTNKKKRSES